MRIDRLYLPRFRNLVDFEVDFDQSSVRQVIVGRNGVGKSNLLEALTRIFRDLDLEEESEFAYEIEYLCNRRCIKIRCVQTNEPEWKANPNVPKRFKRQYWTALEEKIVGLQLGPEKPYEEMAESEFFRRNRPVAELANPDRLLPLYVFGYYSGAVSRFAKIFEKHEERYYKEQIAGIEAPLRPLFQAKAHHSQFALLAFYATHDEQAQKFLADEFRIEGFDSALFSLREPYWKKPKPAKGRKNVGDPRFWFAGGKVSAFLDSLFDQSFAPMTGEERIKISIGQEKSKERRHCFLPDKKALQSLAEGLSNKEFFARLESLVFSDLVDGTGADVRVWIRLKGCKEPATYHDLAEGERQLLTVLGLMRFTAEKEALFLLDEPDTHLNPAWCLDYLDNLRMHGAEPPNSQIIMTTHSPLTFAGMDKNEVVVMERNVDGRIFAEHPSSPPKGMGFAAILTSDFFGLRSTLDKETLTKIDKKREIALKQDKTDDDRKELEQLNNELGRLDFSHTVRDPLYAEFIRAITAATKDMPELKKPSPNIEMWRERQNIAKDIAERLLKLKQSP
ncbi:MAG: DNA replication and repair protein RecF [Prosthecobacter sp.]|nr:DNA replication and repair protein RecF [Prosthecobacter sp.]